MTASREERNRIDIGTATPAELHRVGVPHVVAIVARLRRALAGHHLATDGVTALACEVEAASYRDALAIITAGGEEGPRG